MNKKTILIASFLIILYTYLIYNPIIIDNPANTIDKPSTKNYKKGDTIKAFEAFNFEKDFWKACVIMNERIEVASTIPSGKYLFTEDKEVIKKLKNTSFIYTQSDLATVENQIILYKNDTIVFRSQIVLDKDIEGFQNSTFGWIKTNNNELSSIIKNFKKPMLPFVYL